MHFTRQKARQQEGRPRGISADAAVKCEYHDAIIADAIASRRVPRSSCARFKRNVCVEESSKTAGKSALAKAEI